MALSTVNDYQLALNQLFYVLNKGYGLGFPFYQLTRAGGMSEADARTLQTNFATYYQTREAAQTITPGHEDVPNPKVLEQHGRSNKGGTGTEDTAANTGGKINDTTSTHGRNNHSVNTSESTNVHGTNQTGR